MLHLGDLDESLVRPQDYYLCIKANTANDQAKLYVCWRSKENNSEQSSGLGSNITFLELDTETEPITPLSIEMLAGEDLPQLLQTLLVGVERIICRIPLDELSFPSTSQTENSNINSLSLDSDILTCQSSGVTAKRAECGLKRREIITKGNYLNNKYVLKKFTSQHNESETVDETHYRQNNSYCKDNELISLNDMNSGIASSNEQTLVSTEAVIIKGTTASMPLFCLGGSFPHIDSDEESGDDRKSETGKINYVLCNLLNQWISVYIYFLINSVYLLQSFEQTRVFIKLFCMT